MSLSGPCTVIYQGLHSKWHCSPRPTQCTVHFVGLAELINIDASQLPFKFTLWLWLPGRVEIRSVYELMNFEAIIPFNILKYNYASLGSAEPLIFHLWYLSLYSSHCHIWPYSRLENLYAVYFVLNLGIWSPVRSRAVIGLLYVIFTFLGRS